MVAPEPPAKPAIAPAAPFIVASYIILSKLSPFCMSFTTDTPIELTPFNTDAAALQTPEPVISPAMAPPTPETAI